MRDPRFTLVQLRYFCTTAECGTMTGAAKELAVSQSAVSSAVAHLEHVLAVQLFVRQHARGLILTRAGERFFHDARSFLSHAADLGEIGRDLGESLAGDVSFGCFVTLAPFYLPNVVDQVSRDHPSLKLSIVEGEFEQLHRALRRGEIELALTYDLGLGDDVRQETLGQAHPYIIVHPDHALADREAVRLGEMAHEPLVMLDLPHSREYFRSVMQQVSIESPVRFRSSSYETVRALVAAGCGYAILNQRSASASTYSGGRVVALSLIDSVAPLRIVIASLRTARLTRRAEAVGDVCRRVFGQSGLHR